MLQLESLPCVLTFCIKNAAGEQSKTSSAFQFVTYQSIHLFAADSSCHMYKIVPCILYFMTWKSSEQDGF